MDRFTAALRRSTRQKFNHMARDAFYLKDATSTPVPIRVIVTDRFQALGDLKGTNFNYAEVLDNTPRVEMMLEEIDPKRGFCISIEKGLVYRIDTVQPPEDITVTANVARLPVEQTRNFPFPEANR